MDIESTSIAKTWAQRRLIWPLDYNYNYKMTESVRICNSYKWDARHSDLWRHAAREQPVARENLANVREVPTYASDVIFTTSTGRKSTLQNKCHVCIFKTAKSIYAFVSRRKKCSRENCITDRVLLSVYSVIKRRLLARQRLFLSFLCFSFIIFCRSIIVRANKSWKIVTYAVEQ